MIVTGAAVRSSSSVKVRPEAGSTPSTEKKFDVTRRPRTCSGGPSVVRLAAVPRVAAISLKTRFSSFQLK
jgi:hypothetical protein